MNLQKALFTLATQDEEYRDDVIYWLKHQTNIRKIEKYAQQNKISPTVIQVLDKWNIGITISTLWREQAEHILSQKRFYTQELNDLMRSNLIPPKSILLLKGRAVQRWYPTHLIRQSIDIDCVISNPEWFWSIYLWLTNRGYEQLAMGLTHSSRSSSEELDFIFELEKNNPTENVQFAVFELIHGPSPITSRYCFDFKDIMQRAHQNAIDEEKEDTDATDTFFLYPAREDCLLSLLVETCDRPLILRDAVDFATLIGNRGKDTSFPLDWQVLQKHIEASSMVIPFLRLSQYYTIVSGHHLPHEVLSTCKRWKRQYPHWKLASINPVLSVAAPYAARQGGIAHGFAEIMLSSRNNFLRTRLGNKLFSLLSRSNHQIFNRQNSLTNLLKISNEHRGKCQWVSGKNGALFLQTPVGLFLATQDTEFTEEYLNSVSEEILLV